MLCELCSKQTAKYTCPKCRLHYCSQFCYQSPSHLECSELFYKTCVETELNSQNLAPVDRNQMLQTLKKFTSLDDEEYSEDSDDVDSIADLEERLQHVDLDDADEIWTRLSKDEQSHFNAIVNSGDLASIMPTYEPWWNTRYKKPVQELHLVEAMKRAYKQRCPQLRKVVPFNSLSKKEPSPFVLWNIVNVLGSYVFTVRGHVGEHQDNTEAISTFFKLSANLNSNQNFESKQMALKSVVHLANMDANIGCSEEEACIMRQDVDKLLAGPEDSEKEFYILAALSDLQNTLDFALHLYKGKNKINRQTNWVDEQLLRKSWKKLTYYISWSWEYYRNL